MRIVRIKQIYGGFFYNNFSPNTVYAHKEKTPKETSILRGEAYWNFSLSRWILGQNEQRFYIFSLHPSKDCRGQKTIFSYSPFKVQYKDDLYCPPFWFSFLSATNDFDKLFASGRGWGGGGKESIFTTRTELVGMFFQYATEVMIYRVAL